MVLRRLGLLPVVLFGVLGGEACSSGENVPASPGEDESALVALEGDVGPSGGVLRGSPRSIFAGLALEIPEGALARDTHLKIVPVLDATPLPESSLGVGPQFAAEGELTFQKPVLLTLPVGRDFRDVTSSDHGAGLKVWMRTNEGFRLIEPVSTTDTSVTVETTTLLAASAGRRVFPRPAPDCTAGTCVSLVDCATTGGFCTTEPIDLGFTFGTGSIPGLLRPTAYLDGADASESIVFHTGGQTGSVGRVRVPSKAVTFATQNLSSTALVFETGLLNSFLASGRLVHGVAGDAATATLGRYAFPTGGASTAPALSTPTRLPFVDTKTSRAALTLGDGRTAVFASASSVSDFHVGAFFVRSTAGAVSAPIALAGPSRRLLAVAADPSRPDAFWMFSSVDDTTAPNHQFSLRLERFDANGNVLTAPALTAEVQLRLQSGSGGGSDSFFAPDTFGLAATTEGAFLSFVGPGTPGSTTLLHVRPDGVFDERAPLGGLAFARNPVADREGNLWVQQRSTDGTTAVVFLGPGATGAPQVITLDPNLLIQEVFPSADRGIWVAARPMTGASRPVRLLKIRKSG